MDMKLMPKTARFANAETRHAIELSVQGSVKMDTITTSIGIGALSANVGVGQWHAAYHANLGTKLMLMDAARAVARSILKIWVT